MSIFKKNINNANHTICGFSGIEQEGFNNHDPANEVYDSEPEGSMNFSEIAKIIQWFEQVSDQSYAANLKRVNSDQPNSSEAGINYGKGFVEGMRKGEMHVINYFKNKIA